MSISIKLTIPLVACMKKLLQGQGRLTRQRVDDLQTFYGYALLNNIEGQT